MYLARYNNSYKNCSYLQIVYGIVLNFDLRLEKKMFLFNFFDGHI